MFYIYSMVYILFYIYTIHMLHVGTFDFRPVPYGGDSSFVHQAMETLYYISRATGLSAVDTDHIQGMLTYIRTYTTYMYIVT